MADRWQTGECTTYVVALRLLRPDLRLGSLPGRDHVVAHDDHHIYDSRGQALIPSGADLDVDPAILDDLLLISYDTDAECERALADALGHASRWLDE